MGNRLTGETAQSLIHQPVSERVRREFVDDTGDGGGVGEQLRGLTQLPVIVDCQRPARVQERIPVRHVDQLLLDLLAGVFKLREEPAGTQVVLVLVRLLEGVADEQMVLVILRPVLLRAVRGNTTIRTCELDVFRVSNKLMFRMRAVRIRLDPCGALPDGGGRRLVPCVEEVVWAEQNPRVVAFEHSRSDLAGDPVRRWDG